jgi:hypothetical protein
MAGTVKDQVRVRLRFSTRSVRHSSEGAPGEGYFYLLDMGVRGKEMAINGPAAGTLGVLIEGPEGDGGIDACLVNNDEPK